MYGNTYLDLGEVQIGLYGNSRYSTLNLITANNEIFEEYFQNTNTDINYKKKQLVKGFVAKRYSKEINYEEFFIWWYHFFYTKVTEELIKQGVIITSTQKNQTYIIHQ